MVVWAYVVHFVYLLSVNCSTVRVCNVHFLFPDAVSYHLESGDQAPFSSVFLTKYAVVAVFRILDVMLAFQTIFIEKSPP